MKKKYQTPTTNVIVMKLLGYLMIQSVTEGKRTGYGNATEYEW